MENTKVQKYTGNQDLSKGKVFLKFGAPWCGPCRTSKPIIDELSLKYNGVSFIDVNTDEYNELSLKYNVRSIPMVFILKDGKVQNQIMGTDKIKYIECLNEK